MYFEINLKRLGQLAENFKTNLIGLYTSIIFAETGGSSGQIEV
jgi:hypothetical protein